MSADRDPSGPSGSQRERAAFEERLDELREEARRSGDVRGEGVRAAEGPLPPPTGAGLPPAAGPGLPPAAGPGLPPDGVPAGYYGIPILKPPVWTWEVPVYFFVGGLAGMAAVIGAGAFLLGARPELVRAAMWTGAAGALLSAALLTADLGRPRRFLNMLRIFKPQSAMSVGAWLLTAFGGAVTAAAALAQWTTGPVEGPLWWLLLALAASTAGVLGSLVATYTGVLIGATTIPAWHLHRRLLPVHFGTAGLGSASAFLQLLGFRAEALLALGILAAAVETLVGAAVELRRHGAADRALREGTAGLLLRAGGLLAGPAALALWLAGAVPWGAGAFLAGAFLSRIGWVRAGKVSGRDPEAVLAEQRTGA